MPDDFQGSQFVVNSDYSEEMFIREVKRLYKEKGYIHFKISTKRPATPQQRKALHVYFGLLADELNAAGLDLRRFFELRPKIDIPWNKDLVKEHLWKPIQEVMLKKKSTTDCDTTDYTKVYETLNRFTIEHFHISIPWPNKDDLL